MFSFFLAAFFLYHSTSAICPIDNSSFLNTTSIFPATSPQKEIVNGTTYGNLFSIPGGLWLLYPFNISMTVLKITSSCPTGYVPPTKEDLLNLLYYSGNYSTNYSYLSNPDTFNMSTTFYYLSNTKVYPNNTNYSDANAYKFYSLKISLSNLGKISATVGISSAWTQTATSRVFCISSNSSINNPLSSPAVLNISGLSTRDLIKGIKYSFEILGTNLLGYQWNINGRINNSQVMNIIPMKYGKYQINVKATLFDGSVIGNCYTVWVRNYTGSEANTSLIPQDIHQIQYNDSSKSIYRSTSLHFTSGSAPLAPIDTGGAYIIYADLDGNMNLYVKTIDNDGNQLSELNLSRRGFPMDIVSVDWGFVTLIIDYDDSNLLYLLGINNQTNSSVFNRIIMNNGNLPITFNNEQLIFYTNSSGGAMFGMEAMFNPTNGRLFFAKDRVVCFFAHYNHFGMNSDGSRNDHTGDALVTFNLSGNDEKLAFSWGSSHSLSQSLVYNGDTAMMSSLGDAYPTNIRFATSDIAESNNMIDPYTNFENRLDYNLNESLLEDIIPGNGQGASCGRMGTISVFGDGEFNTLSYSRRSCINVDFEGVYLSSNISKMGLMFFNNNLQKNFDVDLGNGTYINQVQSVKYGNHLFYSYVTSQRESTTQQFLSNTIDSDTDVMTVMLLDQNGSVIDGPYNLTKAILPPSDDLRILSDGRVGWTFVDTNNLLNYYYLTMPEQTPTNINLVLNNGFYSNEDFYFINPADQNIYKDKIYGYYVAFQNNQTNATVNSSAINTTANNSTANTNGSNTNPTNISVTVTTNGTLNNGTTNGTTNNGTTNGTTNNGTTNGTTNNETTNGTNSSTINTGSSGNTSNSSSTANQTNETVNSSAINRTVNYSTANTNESNTNTTNNSVTVTTNGTTNNGTTNGTTFNGTTNHGTTNNGTTNGTNSSITNSGSIDNPNTTNNYSKTNTNASNTNTTNSSVVTTNGTINNGTTNNETTNNGTTNNGTTNNGTTNNGTTNGTTNNGTTNETNSSTTKSGSISNTNTSTNNATTSNDNITIPILNADDPNISNEPMGNVSINSNVANSTSLSSNDSSLSNASSNSNNSNQSISNNTKNMKTSGNSGERTIFSLIFLMVILSAV